MKLYSGHSFLVRDGFLPAAVLDRLPAIVAVIKSANPDMTLQAIHTRLESMRVQTPCGRTSWQPSSVQMLLELAERLDMIQETQIRALKAKPPM